MDKITLRAHVLRIDWASSTLIDEGSLGVTKPLAINKVQNGYLLQSFSSTQRSTFLTYLSPSFTVNWKEKYNVLENPPALDDHFSEEAELPFFTGQYDESTFYFNGFYNLKLAMVFVNSVDGKFKKALEGHRYRAAVSSAVPLGNKEFFLSSYNVTGENRVNASIDLKPNTPGVLNVTNEDDVPVNVVSGYPNRARFFNKKIQSENGEKLISLIPTINAQGELQIRNVTTGALEMSTRIGMFNAFSPVDCTMDGSGQLLLLGETYFANKNARISLVKFSKKEQGSLGL